MIFRRLATAIREQNWFTVFIEFSLIVAGLLVALQIDDWNQQRKDRQDEIYYLNRIIADIDESMSANGQDIDFMRRKVESILWVVRKLRSGELDPGEEALFKEKFLQIQNWKTGVFIDSTIQELQSGGRMTIIQSRDLRERLGRFELMLESHRRAQSNVAEFMKVIELEITPRVDRPVKRDLKMLSAPFNDMGSEESLQELLTPFAALASDKELIRYLDAYANFYIWRYLNIELLQKELLELRQYVTRSLPDTDAP